MALSTREIILVLRARDEASRVFHGLAKNMGGLSAEAVRAMNVAYAHGQALATAGVAVASAGALGIVALNNMADAAMAYNEQTAKTLTQVDKVNVSFDQLKKIGRDVGQTVPVAFDQVQGALYDIFSSIDTDAPGAAILLKGIGKAAVAGAVDMETAGRVNIAILNAWKMKATDITHVNDVMFQLVRKGVGTYDQFGKSIGRAIPSAIRAGQSVESLAGMMAFLTRNGLSTAMSATSAARALDALSNPKTVDNFKKWGVAITDAKGKFRPVVDIIADMKVKLDKLSPAARSAKLQELFKGSGGTIQAMRFFNLALADSGKLLPELTKNMNEAGGASDAAYKIMANTPQAKLQLLNNQWQVMATILGDYVLPIKMAIVDFFSQLLGWFTKLSPNVQKWIVWITAAVSALALLTGGIMAAIGVFAMFSAALALSGLTLGAILSPVLLIIAAIAALVAIGVLVVKNWDLIKAKATEVWNYIYPVINGIIMAFQNFGKAVWDTLGKIWQVIGPTVIAGWNEIYNAVAGTIAKLKPYWDQLVAAFENLRSKAASVSVGVTDWLTRIWTVLQPIVYLIAGALSVLWNVFVKVFTAVWGAISSFVGNVIQILSGLINFFTAVFTGNWSAAWDAVLQILKGIWGAISSVIVGARDVIWGIIEGFIGGIIGFFQHLWEVLVGHSIIPDMIKAIVMWFLKLPGLIFGGIASFVSGIVSRFLGMVSRVVSVIGGWVISMVSKFANLAAQLSSKAGQLVVSVVGFFLTLPFKAALAVAPLAGKLFSAAAEWGAKILSGVRGWVGAVLNFFSGLPSRILRALGDLGGLLWNAGKNILQGLLNGLRDGFGAVQNFVGGIGSWIASHKGPKPYDLALLKPAGNWIMTGLRDALKSQIPGLARDLSGIADTITSTPFGVPPVVPGTGGPPRPGQPGYPGSPPGQPMVKVDVHTQEIDPVKHGAELGFEIAKRLGL